MIIEILLATMIVSQGLQIYITRKEVKNIQNQITNMMISRLRESFRENHYDDYED